MSYDALPPCSVCTGEVMKTGCICGGNGTIYGELSGLRRELWKVMKENELLKSELVKELKKILRKK